jgi:hypothetical protein
VDCFEAALLFASVENVFGGNFAIQNNCVVGCSNLAHFRHK